MTKCKSDLSFVAAGVVGALALVSAEGALAAQTNAPKVPATSVTVETVVEGLENPWGLQFLPDGRMLVTERPGRLRIVSKDGQLSKPVSEVPKVYARGQGGLLDVRLSHNFADDGMLFLSYAEPRDGGKAATAVARARLELTDDGGRLSDVKVIFQQQPAYSTTRHFGSRIVIDKKGVLFITTGDRGQGEPAQNPDETVGKVIRINADGSIPDDNPKPEGWKPEIWSIGHRNIQGAVLDVETGQLWTVEHGARGGDELNHPEKGKNYGWPVITYGRDYSGAKIGIGTEKAGMEQPVYYWDPSIATSGLELYTGDLFPQWKGNFLVGGLAGAQLARLVMKDGQVVGQEILLKDEGLRIRDVRQGPDGAVYLLVDESDGAILRLSPESK
ncbi:PQQ-dependent sugar dehydrogenase [Filomicrobium sp.]|uniref:PQQ-dependent sugar dehydrogenase n=1 Tax=Filomicrobium sp. TaxID=2024831 RepID=UPI002585DBFA|nr:PQQ-dependent sugar dehydrogenase [Filomicrobium sp.]